jgi:hypothetical protein
MIDINNQCITYYTKIQTRNGYEYIMTINGQTPQTNIKQKINHPKKHKNRIHIYGIAWYLQKLINIILDKTTSQNDLKKIYNVLDAINSLSNSEIILDNVFEALKSNNQQSIEDLQKTYQNNYESYKMIQQKIDQQYFFKTKTFCEFLIIIFNYGINNNKKDKRKFNCLFVIYSILLIVIVILIGVILLNINKKI